MTLKGKRVGIYRVAGLVLAVAMGASAAAQSTSETDKQKPTEGGQSGAMGGGVNTAGAHAAVLDAEHRPITAGGFVKSGPVVFTDIAEKSGLR